MRQTHTGADPAGRMMPGDRVMKKQVILLNGPSSSGKSTLAAALLNLLRESGEERYEIVSIDDFMKVSPTETIYEDDVFEISGDMCARAAEILRAGGGVIIDHVITSERIYRQLRDRLSAWPVRTVRVSCPPALLKQRELERGDRCPGSAESSEKYLYPKEGYELTADTGAGTPDENARLITNAFFDGARPARDGTKPSRPALLIGNVIEKRPQK